MSTEWMSQWWDTLSVAQQLFWGIALFFSALFIFQFVINLIGFGLDLDSDAGPDVATDHDVHIDPGFAWLSVRSVIAFFTFFGWAGVIVLSRGGPLLWALLIAFLSGMLAMSLVGYLLYLFSQQTQIGNYHIDEALYHTGEVYLTIPARKSGVGKILIQLGNGTREVDALTEGKMLPNGSIVRVTGILGDTLVLVEAVRDSGDSTS